MVRGLHHESATHSEYPYEPTINISATLATSARDGIRLDYFCRIGVNCDEIIKMYDELSARGVNFLERPKKCSEGLM